MPGFVGFILGVVLTILCAYIYDAATGRAGNGLTAEAANGQAPMVNWDVVSSDWHSLQTHVHDTADNIERSFRHTS
jgi:rubredoxin